MTSVVSDPINHVPKGLKTYLNRYVLDGELMTEVRKHSDRQHRTARPEKDAIVVRKANGPLHTRLQSNEDGKVQNQNGFRKSY